MSFVQTPSTASLLDFERHNAIDNREGRFGPLGTPECGGDLCGVYHFQGRGCCLYNRQTIQGSRATPDCFHWDRGGQVCFYLSRRQAQLHYEPNSGWLEGRCHFGRGCVSNLDDWALLRLVAQTIINVVRETSHISSFVWSFILGAFRTGKSFLLSWFLTYLHCLPKLEDGPGALMEEGGTKKKAEKWFESVETIKQDGFHWQAGSERDTTGIWMWSQPFYRGAASGEPTAILLVDSQGMFDNETTMKLTSSIFGLSTLLSSYQIYNVDKRIQEDNLQQLALFSEYARSADIGSATDENIQKTAADKPFQTMEFLVRDWQHFEDEDDYDQMEREMAEYLEKVISEREAKDLQETREQIQSCFEKITCYGLTHPGMAVIKKNFQGEVSKMDETFLNLLDRYCRRVFSTDNLKPKVIHGRELSAAELGSYIKAYAGMFATGASFPEASTMLEATTSAHYTNAVNTAVSLYNHEMDRVSGAKCSNYVMPKMLQDEHRHKLTKSLEAFKSMATFGSKRVIDDARQSIIDRINDDFEKFSAMNEGRNPLKGAGT